MKLNNKEIADVYHYAPEPSFEPEKYLALGVISADNGELPLTLEGSNGKDWRNATDLSFTYSVDMMLTARPEKRQVIKPFILIKTSERRKSPMKWLSFHLFLGINL